MANYNNYKGKKKSKYSNLEKTAFAMGLVKRGLKNPNSKIYESYNAGINSKKDPQAKKTMFGD